MRRHCTLLRRFVLPAALAAGLLLGCSPPQPFELTILHTNDVHARFQEISRFGGSCRPDDAQAGRCFGGVARRATKVGQIRDEGGSVLLLDGGDQFQGTLFYNRFKGAAAAELMNHLRYDAMVVGNHEFDDGPEVLETFARAVHFPVLATNLDLTDEPGLASALKTSTVIQRDERAIGVVGYITEETESLSSAGPTVKFLPVEDAVRAEVQRLEESGIDVIIALSHAGMERDRQVAAAIEGIDIIVGGHTNTLLSNDDEDSEGPYPTVVESPRGEPVLIVTAFAWGKYLGRLDVVFNERGVAEGWRGGPILLDAQVAPDPDTVAKLEPFAAEVVAFTEEIVGAAAVPLRGDERSCRFGECNLGNLITDALLEHGQRQGAEIAIQNAGGIRSSIDQGPISVADVLQVLPFGNTFASFELLGSDLLTALETGVSQAEDPDNDGTGRFLQVAGLRYRYTLDAEPGGRIRGVEIRDREGSWQPLETDRRYKVVTNDFIRTGGDGFEVLEDRAIDPYDQGQTVADILAGYLRRESPVAPEIEGRIQRVDE